MVLWFHRIYSGFKNRTGPMLDWYAGLHLLSEQGVLTYIINISNKVNSYTAHTGKVFGNKNVAENSYRFKF